ncbi:MAG: efflux RND transporter periplasmic adaptor subunit [Muribaculaceae bacterium]
MTRNIIFLVSILTLLAGCNNRSAKTEKIQSVNVAVAESASDGETVSFPGRTKASEEINVSFRVAGPLLQVVVKEGEYVNKGQLIAVMDDRDYKLQLAATEAEYNNVKAEAERIMAMYSEGTTTAQNYDHARYGLMQITQKLNIHRNQLADTRLLAPVSGYIKAKMHEGGETVSEGMPIVSIAVGKRVEVEINISAREYARLSSLSDFRCRIDALSDNEFTLTPVSAARVPNANQLYSLRYSIDGVKDFNKVTPGMSTIVYAKRNSSASMVIVPSGSVLYKEGKTWVFTINSASREVKAIEVIVNSVKNDGTTVVAGIAPGDTIVSSGVHHIHDGEKVKITAKPTSTNIGGMM